MGFPFGKELDEVFRSDRSVWLKVGGCAAVAAFVTTFALWKQARRGGLGVELTNDSLVLIGLIAAVIGGMVGLLLSLKDVVERRLEGGRSVHPMLRLYLGSGRKSLVAWSVTVVVVVFVLGVATSGL